MRVATAKPVEPLAHNGWIKFEVITRRLVTRRAALFSIVMVMLLITVGIFAAFIDFRPSSQSAAEMPLSTKTNETEEKTLTETPTVESAPVAIDRPENRFLRQHTSHQLNHKSERASEPIEVTDFPTKGKGKARLVSVIH